MKTQWFSLALLMVLLAGTSLGLTSCKNKEPDMGVPNTYQFRDPGNVELKRKLEQHQGQPKSESMTLRPVFVH